MHEFESLLKVGIVGMSSFRGAPGIDSAKESNERFPYELMVSRRIANSCEDLGPVCRPLSNSILLRPPLIFSESQLAAPFELLRLGVEDTLAGILRWRSFNLPEVEHFYSVVRQSQMQGPIFLPTRLDSPTAMPTIGKIKHGFRCRIFHSP